MLAATFLAASSTLTSAAMTTAPFTNSSRWDPRTYQHKEKLTFEQLGSAIRLVVLACKRPLALNALLENLDSVGEAGGYEKFQVPLLISIDVPRGQLTAPDDVVDLANDFKWNYGQKSVRVQPTHQGILGQWLGLRTDVENPWMAILEDDLALSPCFYSYLLRARHVYGMRDDIAGFTLQKHGPCLTESQFCAPREVESESSYLVRCVGTWGFMPTPHSWSEFTEWQLAHNETSPVAALPGQLVHHKWYAEFIKGGKLDSFWSVWHLAYTHAVGKATLVAELPQPLSLPHGQQPSEHGNEPGRPGTSRLLNLKQTEPTRAAPSALQPTTPVPRAAAAAAAPVATPRTSAVFGRARARAKAARLSGATFSSLLAEPTAATATAVAAVATEPLPLPRGSSPAEMGLLEQCGIIREPDSHLWKAEPVAYDYDAKTMEWPPGPNSTNMPSRAASLLALNTTLGKRSVSLVAPRLASTSDHGGGTRLLVTPPPKPTHKSPTKSKSPLGTVF